MWLLKAEYVNLSIVNFYDALALQVIPQTLDLALSIPCDHISVFSSSLLSFFFDINVNLQQYPKLVDVLPFLATYADRFPQHFLSLDSTRISNCFMYLIQELTGGKPAHAVVV